MNILDSRTSSLNHDDAIKWRYFSYYWIFVQGIHRSPVNSPHKGQWRGALMFCLIWAWINGWVNSRKADDLRHHCAYCDVTVMRSPHFGPCAVITKHIHERTFTRTHAHIRTEHTQTVVYVYCVLRTVLYFFGVIHICTYTQNLGRPIRHWKLPIIHKQFPEKDNTKSLRTLLLPHQFYIRWKHQ